MSGTSTAGEGRASPRRRKRQQVPRGLGVVGIYCRVSTTGQEENTSLDSQERRCREWAAANGYTVSEAHVYREVWTEADLWGRKVLDRLRAAVRAGEVVAILAYDQDRLTRESNHIAVLDDECQRFGARILLTTEDFDASDTGKLIRAVKAFADGREREKIRERTTRGKRAYAERGQLLNSGHALYGYHQDREARVRRMNEAEAAVVRDIFRWYA